MAFYLQDVSAGTPPTAQNTLARLVISVRASGSADTGPGGVVTRPKGTSNVRGEALQARGGPPRARGSSWVTAADNPADARPLGDFDLYAVIGTWMEEDVAGATVKNAFTQGCSGVYVVDNASPDGTVAAAEAAGAVVARTFETESYDESVRLRQMLEVASEISATSRSASVWWLFLDADEFPHGPAGLTLRDYLSTLDERFRVVGARFINHYPSSEPHYVSGRHPLDFQPLCEELAYPMCKAGHRKHPLIRYDRGGPAIQIGNGFHVAYSPAPLFEPAQPVFLHHFPFREQEPTRRRLEALWGADGQRPRADAARDTHMLARIRSLDAVYAGNWAEVHNFAPLDPMADSLPDVAAKGVKPVPWSELVDGPDQHVLRWYPMTGAWDYEKTPSVAYGDDTTYRRGLAFLDGHGDIEDWGSGPGHARDFVKTSRYIGVDGSASGADRIADLREYRSSVDCIFMRHVLEHNTAWRDVLANAVGSFRKRMAIVIFTPFAERTHQINTSTVLTTIPVPDISFRREDLLEYFAGLRVTEEAVKTESQYGIEHIFYLERILDFPRLESELDAVVEAGQVVHFWLRDDDAVADTPSLQRLLASAARAKTVPAIGVIPERADQSLVRALGGASAHPWQHGWAHRSWGPVGEFGEGRPVDELIRDAQAGREQMDQLFGPQGWQRVFVPPYHLLAMPFKVLLPRLGYAGLSAGPPLTPRLPHVREVNAMIDIMDWPRRTGRDAASLEEALLDELAQRRSGATPMDEPIGILSHHLAMDEGAWVLLDALVDLVQSHPGATFVDAGALFQARVDSPIAEAAL